MERLILQRLLKWKHSPYRKPLILKGVRQLEKTWGLKDLVSCRPHSAQKRRRALPSPLLVLIDLDVLIGVANLLLIWLWHGAAWLSSLPCHTRSVRHPFRKKSHQAGLLSSRALTSSTVRPKEFAISS